MHISNVNPSELKCRQNFNLCHAGGQFTIKKKRKEKKEKKGKKKKKRTDEKENPKQLLKYQDENQL